jgi:hypothetical protein
MKSAMTKPIKGSIVWLVIAFLTSANLFALDVSYPDKGRIIDDSTYRNTSAIDILSANYGDLLAVHNSENSRTKELRLAMALKIFDTTYNSINKTSIVNPDQKRFLPSPEALLKIDNMLSSIDSSTSSMSDAEYVDSMRTQLNKLGSAAENELIRNVLQDMENNKDTIKDLNPDSPQNLLNQLLNSVDGSEDEDGTDDSGPPAQDVPDVKVPDDLPDRAEADDSTYVDNNFEENLQNTTSDTLTTSDLDDWSDQELADRISALSELADSGNVNANLALMEQLQKDREEQKRNNENSSAIDNTTAIENAGGNGDGINNINVETTQSEGNSQNSEEDNRRASDIANLMSQRTDLSLFDSALVNMTDFFHTDKDSEENPDQTGTGVFDPLTLKELSQDDLDNMNITDNFDTELVQGGSDEGISERNVSE